MATAGLPRYAVLNVAATNTYVYRKDDGSVVDGKADIFSELAKIELERSIVDNKCVHLRFTHNNKYWQKKSDEDDSIVAVSNKPDEDTTMPSCTLFQLIQQSDNVVYLSHV